MLGFKAFYNARRVIIGIELAQENSQTPVRNSDPLAVESRPDLASRHGSIVRIAVTHFCSYRSDNPICTRTPQEDPWRTGVALLNTSNTTANVEVYVMNPDGTLIGGALDAPDAAFTLEPNAKGRPLAGRVDTRCTDQQRLRLCAHDERTWRSGDSNCSC